MTKFQNPNHVVFWSDEDGGFIATSPDHPGCSAFGETAQKALLELDDAIESRARAVAKANQELAGKLAADARRIPFNTGDKAVKDVLNKSTPYGAAWASYCRSLESNGVIDGDDFIRIVDAALAVAPPMLTEDMREACAEVCETDFIEPRYPDTIDEAIAYGEWHALFNAQKAIRAMPVVLEFPEPMREAPAPQTEVWFADADAKQHVGRFIWGSGEKEFQSFLLALGICHATCEAAAKHGEYLASRLPNHNITETAVPVSHWGEIGGRHGRIVGRALSLLVSPFIALHMILSDISMHCRNFFERLWR